MVSRRGRQAGRVLWPFALVLGVLAACALIASLELMAQRVLVDQGVATDPWGWSAAQDLPPAQPWDQETQTLTYLDPLLGFALDPVALRERTRSEGTEIIDGFVVHPAPPGDEATLLIVALGGSTTAPDSATWVTQLSELLTRKGYRARVFNGGVPGYSSSQDLLKLIRDVVLLEPDIVIALEGVNDLRFLHGIREQPLVHPYAVTTLNYVSEARISGPFPNLRRLAQRWLRGDRWQVEGISLGPPVDLAPAESWMKNARTARAVTDEFGIHYLVGMQPIMGVGGLDPDERERELLAQLYANPRYLGELRSFYDEAGQLSEGSDAVVDLTEIFSGESGVYKDARHQTPEGGRILAESIYAEIERRGWLAQD